LRRIRIGGRLLKRRKRRLWPEGWERAKRREVSLGERNRFLLRASREEECRRGGSEVERGGRGFQTRRKKKRTLL